jgi:hypothetical protein
MTSQTYIDPFSGQTISPTQTGFVSISISEDTSLAWAVNGNNTDTVANIIEVIATAAGLRLIMPPASQVSTGMSSLINNIGENDISIVDNDGAVIATIGSGDAKYIYVTNNDTAGGEWASIAFGSGTSSADAGVLAGYGLIAIGSQLNQATPLVNISSSATLLSKNRATFFNFTGGVGSITLPPASSVGNDWFCILRNSGTGILTVQASGGSLIDSLSSAQLQLTESFVVVSNGISGYATYAYGRSSAFAYTQLAKTVTGGTVTLTPVEYVNTIQGYFGTLTSDCEIILPSTVQLYSVNNQTIGAFRLTFKTLASVSKKFTVPTGQTAILICDGTNVYSAATTPIGTLSSISLDARSASSPSLNFNDDGSTGIFSPSTGSVAVSVAGVIGLVVSPSGTSIVGGVGGGVF